MTEEEFRDLDRPVKLGHSAGLVVWGWGSELRPAPSRDKFIDIEGQPKMTYALTVVPKVPR